MLSGSHRLFGFQTFVDSYFVYGFSICLETDQLSNGLHILTGLYVLLGSHHDANSHLYFGSQRDCG